MVWANVSLSPSTETCELCPPGWQLHRGRCYYFSEEAVSWDDSQRNCLAKKSQLLVIEDEIEMVSLAAALKNAQQASTLAKHFTRWTSKCCPNIRCTHSQTRTLSGAEHLTPYGQDFISERVKRRNREKHKRSKYGNHHSFDWEEEMLGLPTHLQYLALRGEVWFDYYLTVEIQTVKPPSHFSLEMWISGYD